MAGAVVMIVVLVLMPVGILMSGAVGSALLGWLVKSEVDTRYEGHELLELSEHPVPEPQEN
jgi:hypothetical protein